MENLYVLIAVGLVIGTLGTLIGAGGGFILVPLLIIFHPEFPPETITAISMAIVATNALSGTAAYVYKRRVDYKAGLIFALMTVPGSILGVKTVEIMPRHTFDIFFALLLIAIAVFLFVRGGKKRPSHSYTAKKGWLHTSLTDRDGEKYEYAYNVRNGSILSIVTGYLSPVLGIGGGIIHVPAMVEWLRFPVHIATATSHFILVIMASVTVATHFIDGTYDDPAIVKMIIALALGVIPGAQLGAYLSGRLNGKAIIRALSACLVLVGIRILLSGYFGS